MAAFAQFGSDLDATTQRLLARGARLTELLKQPQFAPLTTPEQVAVIYAGVNGYLDRVAVADIGAYEQGLLTLMRGQNREILDAIGRDKQITDDTGAKLKAAVENFTKTFTAQREAAKAA